MKEVQPEEEAEGRYWEASSKSEQEEARKKIQQLEAKEVREEEESTRRIVVKSKSNLFGFQLMLVTATHRPCWRRISVVSQFTP